MEFKSFEPGQGYSDLLPLLDMIGDARVVGLGEFTHGSRDVNRLRHRVFEMLVTERGFTTLSFEECMPKAYRVGEYVRTGRGDARDVLGRNLYWALRTEEVLDLVEWMRAYNAGGGGPIDLTGCDMQSVEEAVGLVRECLDGLGRDFDVDERLERVLEADGDHDLRGHGIQAWFPIEEVRGRRVRYSGYLRTRDADESAHLYWWAGGERGTLAHEALEGRRPPSDSGWTRYVIDTAVPEEAEVVSFGVCIGGNGSVWIDGLRIEIDGQSWRDPARIDLDLGTDDLTGWWVDYRNAADRDPDAARDGRPTLRLRPAKPIPPCSTTDEEALALAKEVHRDLEASESRLAAALSPDGAAWTIRNALAIAQAFEMRTGAGDLGRARSMAENLLWQVDRGAKLVYWAHNGHVRRGGGETGGHLSRALGRRYVPVCSAGATGSYLAMHSRWSDGLGEFPLAEPPPGSFEAALGDRETRREILDLRTNSADDPELGFLAETRPFRNVGGSALPIQFAEQRIRDDFDLLVWLEETTAARPIPLIE